MSCRPQDVQLVFLHPHTHTHSILYHSTPTKNSSSLHLRHVTVDLTQGLTIGGRMCKLRVYKPGPTSTGLKPPLSWPYSDHSNSHVQAKEYPTNLEVQPDLPERPCILGKGKTPASMCRTASGSNGYTTNDGRLHAGSGAIFWTISNIRPNYSVVTASNTKVVVIPCHQSYDPVSLDRHERDYIGDNMSGT